MTRAADGGYRRGEPFGLKDTADAAVGAMSTISNVVEEIRTRATEAPNED